MRFDDRLKIETGIEALARRALYLHRSPRSERAFQVHTVDYLLKPVEQPRLEEAVRRVRSVLEANKTDDPNARLMNLIVSMTGHSESAIEALVDQRSDAQYVHTAKPM